MPETRRKLALWTAREGTRFLNTARTHRLYALFYLGMATGMRRGELLGLRWQDITVTTLHVRQNLVSVGSKLIFQTPKAAKGMRRIALSFDVLEVLELHRQRQLAEQGLLGTAWPESGLVFVSEVGTPVNPHNLTRLRNSLMDAAKVPRVRLHDLRHLHASILVRHGLDPKAVAERLGHSRASFTLDIYTHILEEQRVMSAVPLTNWLIQERGEPN